MSNTDIKTVLPPLPYPVLDHSIAHPVPGYTAKQMEAYAEAAVLAASAPAQELVCNVDLEGDKKLFDQWCKENCFQKPPSFAYDFAFDAWKHQCASINSAHAIIADLLICFDDGVGEDWNSSQLAAAREFVDDAIYDERIRVMQASQSPQDQVKEK